MPLIKGKSQKTFVKNLKTEIHEGKPMKQSLAIAYAMKRKHKAKGGKVDERAQKFVQENKYRPQHGEVGVHQGGGGEGNLKGRSAAGVTAEWGKKHKTDWHREGAMAKSKELHNKKLQELKNMPNPNIKGLAEGGEASGADEAQESMRKAFHFSDGGDVDEVKYTGHMKPLPKPSPTPDSEETLEARKKASESFKSAMGFSKGGEVYNVSTPEELLQMQVEPGFVPDHPQYEWVPGIVSPENVAAKHEDSKGLNQHRVDMQASTDMGEEDRVDRIMNKKSKDFSSLARLAHGGPVDASSGDGPYEDDEDSLVNRIMHKHSEPFSDLDRYSKGGRVANQEHGENNNDLAGFSPNEFDDLVLRDDLESHYGDDDNSGDAIGNMQEDEDRKDIVARIMRSQRKKDRLPNPA